MDAMKFLSEAKRMCSNAGPCSTCDANEFCGVLAILPCLMNPIQYRTPEDTCATGMMCMDCRKKYWGQEVE